MDRVVSGYLPLLQNIAEELVAMGRGLDEVASAVADWRIRWIRQRNPFR